MTNLHFAKSVKPDDGCDWTAVILWRMSAIARARSSACFVPAPRPVRVCEITPPPNTTAGALARKPPQHCRKTHTATVIYPGGERRVQIRETATVWTASATENYDKITGYRAGNRGYCRLVLESIRPLEPHTAPRPGGELSAQALVALMQGNTLSYQGILSAVKKHHPDITISLSQIRKRVWGMLQSDFIDMECHDDLPVTRFTLLSVDPRFYTWSARNMRR